MQRRASLVSPSLDPEDPNGPYLRNGIWRPHNEIASLSFVFSSVVTLMDVSSSVSSSHTPVNSTSTAAGFHNRWLSASGSNLSKLITTHVVFQLRSASYEAVDIYPKVTGFMDIDSSLIGVHE